MSVASPRESTGLTPENESFIQQQLSAGAYANRGAILNAGVDILRQHAALVERIKHAEEQIKRGEYTEYDDEGLRKFFDELIERATRSAAPTRRES